MTIPLASVITRFESEFLAQYPSLSAEIVASVGLKMARQPR